MSNAVRLIRYIGVYALICVVLVLLAGWMQLQLYLWPNKINEFSGLYVVIAAYVSPFIWFIAWPFHLYFYYKKSENKNKFSFYTSLILAILYFVLSYFLQKN